MSICVLTMTRHAFIYIDMSRQCHDMFKQCPGHINVMPMVLSMVPLHLLGCNDISEVKHDFFRHVIPIVLALLPCDANCIINGIILFIM